MRDKSILAFDMKNSSTGFIMSAYGIQKSLTIDMMFSPQQSVRSLGESIFHTPSIPTSTGSTAGTQLTFGEHLHIDI